MRKLSQKEKAIVDKISAYNRVSKLSLDLKQLKKQFRKLDLQSTTLLFNVSKLKEQYTNTEYQLLNAIDTLSYFK